jgi:hypothetical protein
MTYYEEKEVSLKLQKLSLSTFFHVFFTHEKNTVQSAKQLCLYNVMIGTLFPGEFVGFLKYSRIGFAAKSTLRIKIQC